MLPLEELRDVAVVPVSTAPSYVCSPVVVILPVLIFMILAVVSSDVSGFASPTGS